jgi:hypothetical protein
MQAFSQGAKTDSPRNTMDVATYFRGYQKIMAPLCSDNSAHLFYKKVSQHVQ